MINLIKNIFGDIFILYKNFFHFNLSKIVIYLVALLYTLILFIPFGLFFGGLYYYLVSSGGLYSIMGNLVLFIPAILIALLGFFTLLIGFSYNYVLLTKLNLKYIKGKKLNLSKNYYFNFKLFWVFFKTMFLNILIILFPIVIGLILMSILILSFGGVIEAQKISSSGIINNFTIYSVIIFILSLIGFIYLIYKTLFVSIILVDESKGEKFKKPFHYIKKSFKLTSGFKVFFRLLVVSLLVLIVTLPISIPLNHYTDLNKKISDYIDYNIDPESFSKEQFFYIEGLKAEFEGKDLIELSNTLNKNIKYRILLEVLNFLFIFGLFEMMLLSFYKRELLGEKKEETKKELKEKKVKRGRARPKKTDK